MTDTLLLLVMVEAEPAIDPAASLEDRCRAAMTAVLNHFMVTDPEIQFKGAVAAVYAATDDAGEKTRIEEELAALNVIAKLLDGTPIDMVKLPEHPIGLRKMWLEVTGG